MVVLVLTTFIILFWLCDRCFNRVTLACLEATWFHYLYSPDQCLVIIGGDGPQYKHPQWLDNPILLNRLVLFTPTFFFLGSSTQSQPYTLTAQAPSPLAPTQQMEMDSNLCLWIGWDLSPLGYQWIEGLGSEYWYLFYGKVSPLWAIL